MPTPKQKKIQTNKGVKLRPAVALATPDAIVAELKQNEQLTVNQVTFLQHMLELPELPNTIRELCKTTNISFQAFYGWVKEVAFLQAYNQVCDVVDALDRPWIDAANRKAARNGNIAAQRTYYLRRGLLGTNNQVNTQVNIDFSSLDSKVG